MTEVLEWRVRISSACVKILYYLPAAFLVTFPFSNRHRVTRTYFTTRLVVESNKCLPTFLEKKKNTHISCIQRFLNTRLNEEKKRKEDTLLIVPRIKLISIIYLSYTQRDIYISFLELNALEKSFFTNFASVDSGLEIQFTELCSAIHARPPLSKDS